MVGLGKKGGGLSHSKTEEDYNPGKQPDFMLCRLICIPSILGRVMTHHLTSNEIEQIYGPMIEFVESIPERVTWAKKCSDADELQALAQEIGGLLNAPLPTVKIKALRSVGQQLAFPNPHLSGQSDSVVATIVTEIWKPSLVDWLKVLADIVLEPDQSSAYLKQMYQTWCNEECYEEVLNFLLDERAFLLSTLLKLQTLDCDRPNLGLDVTSTHLSLCEVNQVKTNDTSYHELWGYAQKMWASGTDKFKICKHISSGPGNYSACVEDLVPDVKRTDQTKRFHAVLHALNQHICDALGLRVYRLYRSQQILVERINESPNHNNKPTNRKRSTKTASKKKSTTKRKR